MTAGFVAGCAAVLAYSATSDSSSSGTAPDTKRLQYEKFKSQFPSE